MDQFFHVGIVVVDMAAAMRELTAAVGVTWCEPNVSTYQDWDILVAYSREGPPFLELIEAGPDAGPWAAPEGARLDHIGYWADDLARDRRHLESAGFQLEFDGAEHERLFTYHRGVATGIRLELLHPSRRAPILSRTAAPAFDPDRSTPPRRRQ